MVAGLWFILVVSAVGWTNRLNTGCVRGSTLTSLAGEEFRYLLTSICDSYSDLIEIEIAGNGFVVQGPFVTTLTSYLIRNTHLATTLSQLA